MARKERRDFDDLYGKYRAQDFYGEKKTVSGEENQKALNDARRKSKRSGLCRDADGCDYCMCGCDGCECCFNVMECL